MLNKELIEIINNQLNKEKQRMVDHASDNLNFQGRVYALEDLLETVSREG